VPQTPTSAWQTPEETTAGRIFADDIASHPGKSGAILLPGGREALLTRNAMAGIAERTLDVQYYIWKGDTVGLLLIQRLVEAADRGVRVRVLLDDHTVKAKDLSLASFSGHPNMEIRLFNPLAGRKKGPITFLADFSRVNHRMHNKLFVMDNALAVIGGRNIADRYFGVSSKANTRDLDVAVTGPVVEELSETFDLFWNSRQELTPSPGPLTLTHPPCTRDSKGCGLNSPGSPWRFYTTPRTRWKTPKPVSSTPPRD
jgi:putative cardiolipin synthase